jgi:hypothetical protein
VVSLFLISAIRAIVEMLGLCMIGQGILYFLAGRQRATNRVYQLFDLITKPPRRIVATFLPRSTSGAAIGMLSFAIVLILWLGLAFVRKFV